MKITICGSLAFVEEMKEVKDRLVELGHEVILPYSAEMDITKQYLSELRKNDFEKFVALRTERTIDHFDKVKSSDAILVLNYDKNGKKNYIGGSAFMEMAVAFEHDKKIFLLNPNPDDSSYEEEIVSMQPIVINGDLTKIV